MGFADRREPFAFFGAILLNVLLGSLYCWSCYLVPLEQALGVGRGLLSGVFSLTTVCFTVAVAKIGPGLYSRLNPAVIGAGAAVVAGAGLLLASQALPYVSVVPLFFGYALLFGVAAGVGYGLSVQISAIAPFGEGLSTGLVTSARAIGAFAFTPVIRRLLDVGGPGHAMWTVGALLLASSAPLWVMLSRGGLDEPLANGRRDASEALTPEETERNRQLRPALITVWAALCLGVQAGLMVVSHAAALLRTHGASISIATAGVSIVSAFSTLGRVLGGWGRPAHGAAGARGAPRRRRRWRAAAAGNSVVAAQTALAAASFAYGVLASAVPVEVRRRVGRRDFSRAYGFVYTAWGLAGLAAPALAGVLFDARGSYTAALTVATALSLGSAVVAATLRPGRSHEEWAAAIAEAKAREGAGGEDDDERTSSSDGDPTSESRSEPVAPAGA